MFRRKKKYRYYELQVDLSSCTASRRIRFLWCMCSVPKDEDDDGRHFVLGFG
jgi:hypothetical protein